MSGLILPVSVLLYVALPIWMLTRDWPVRAGMAMVGVALLPWAVWLLTNEGPLGPGAGIAFMGTALMVLLGLVLMGLGATRVLLRLFGRGRMPSG